MTASEETNDPLEDIRKELGKVVTDQTSRLSRQDLTIADMTIQIGDLTLIIKEMQSALGLGVKSGESSNQKATRSIRLDLPKFQGIDPKGWLFQAEEYS